MPEGLKEGVAPSKRTRPGKKDERTVHEVAREAFEKCVAAGDGPPPRPMSDVNRLG